MQKNIFLSATYFLLSIVITWWFIAQAELLYVSQQLMLLSCSIAGAKWAIQIVAALLLLNQKKWMFIEGISFVCFVGSCVLIPYCLFAPIRLLQYSFLISIIVAVIIMMAKYYVAVKKLAISMNWYWCWIVSLVIAITLQLFVVF